MEIEKKFLVKQLPDGLESFPSWELEQCYLCTSPTIRARRKGGDYILTYKNRMAAKGGTDKLNVSEEIEMPLTKESYEHLREKADGRCIAKTRYVIPYGSHKIELDVFHREYEGFILAEVEFDTIEESKNFVKPDWFSEDVSGDYRYTNSFLALQETKK